MMHLKSVEIIKEDKWLSFTDNEMESKHWKALVAGI